MRVSASPIIRQAAPQQPGNGGIVPPWLREPIRIVLPVEPGEDDVTLPVIPHLSVTQWINASKGNR